MSTSFTPCEPALLLEKTSKELFNALLKLDPLVVPYLNQLAQGFFGAQTCRTFSTTSSYRLMGHARSCYQKVSKHSVLAIKGSEVGAKDLDGALKDMSVQSFDQSLISTLDFFPIHEYKVPLALTLPEAEREFKASLNLQTLYLARYGELAQLPVPLAIHPWDDAHIQAHKALLKPLLSGHAYDLCEKIMKPGLVTFTYYYPNPPLRVKHIEELLAQKHARSGFADRLHNLSQKTEVENTLKNWIELWTRIIFLGYFPVTLSHHSIGQMIRTQNAVIDGGFVDTDSLQPIDQTKDPKLLYQTALASVLELCNTVEHFLLGNAYSRQKEYQNPTTQKCMILSFVIAEIKKAIAAEEALGFALPHELKKIYTFEFDFEELSHILTTLYPAYQKFEPDHLPT